MIKKGKHDNKSCRKDDSQKKHVCIIKYAHYPQHTHVLKDARTLTEEGYEVDVISLRLEGQKSHEVIDGVNVHRLPMEKQRGGMLRYIFEYTCFFVLAFWKLTCLSLKKRYKGSALAAQNST